MSTLNTIIEFVAKNPNPDIPSGSSAATNTLSQTGDLFLYIACAIALLIFITTSILIVYKNKAFKKFNNANYQSKTNNKQNNKISQIFSNKKFLTAILFALIAICLCFFIGSQTIKAMAQNTSSFADDKIASTSDKIKAVVDTESGEINIDNSYLKKEVENIVKLKKISINKCEGITGIDNAIWNINVVGKNEFNGKINQSIECDSTIENENIKYSVSNLDKDTALSLIGKETAIATFDVQAQPEPKEPYTITGLIYNDNNIPIENAKVQFWKDDKNTTENKSELIAETTTDTQGKYIIKLDNKCWGHLHFSAQGTVSKNTETFFVEKSTDRKITILQSGNFNITDLKTDGEINPCGIENDTPQFSWVMQTTAISQQQFKYHIVVKEVLSKTEVMNQEKESSECSATYNGADLLPNTKYMWSVTVSDIDGNTQSAGNAYFSTGLKGDWSDAKYIGFYKPESDNNEIDENENIDEQNDVIRVTTLRREIPEAQDKEIESASLFSTGLGVYETYIDGQRVGIKENDSAVYYNELQPGFTENFKRQYYTTYDVTWMMQNLKTHAISAVVTSGWWSGDAGGGQHYNYLREAYKAKLIIKYKDGSSSTIVTNTKDWMASDNASPITAASIFYGEDYNAGKDVSWKYANYDYSKANWQPAIENNQFSGKLEPWFGSQIRIRPELQRNWQNATVFDPNNPIGEIPNVQFGKINVKRTYAAGEDIVLEPGEKLIVDCMQNAAGWENFCVNSTEAGATITVEHGEMLNDNNGEISRNNNGQAGSAHNSNRGARATTKYTVGSANTDETYHPTLTYYGFRYLQFSATAKIIIKSVHADTVTSATKDTGFINTHNKDINQIISNSRWSMYSNYFSVPTDCPQRDERQGWMGDTQVYASTGIFLNDSKTFLQKFCLDMQDSQCTAESELPQYKQHTRGAYPSTSPLGYYKGGGGGCEDTNWGATGWSDCGIILPYTLYTMYGDTWAIKENWESMEAYMNYIQREWPDDGPYGCWGDWLALDGNDDVVKGVLNLSYWAMDAKYMAIMAQAIGKDQSVIDKYNKVYEHAKSVFQSKYIKNGQLEHKEYQTVCLYPLYLDLLPENMVDDVAQQLVSNIVSKGTKLQTGFMGTKILLDTLDKIGQSKLAYDLLLQDSYPSWLYPVKQGATTVWERWDAYVKETGFHDLGMNSFNHYAYGAVVSWMYHTMLGINEDISNTNTVGFKNIKLNPYPDSRFSNVEGQYNSCNGLISVASAYQGINGWNYSFQIPANSTCQLCIPKLAYSKFTVNGKDINDCSLIEDGIEIDNSVTKNDDYVYLKSTSGQFTLCASIQSATAVLVKGDHGDYHDGDFIFFYDGKNHSDLGTTYEITDGQNVPWTNSMSEIRQVYFDKSFKTYPHIISTNSWFKNAENLVSFNGENFDLCQNITNSNNMFEACKQLQMKNLQLPNKFSIIGDEAFLNCENLDNIFLSEDIKAVGHNAFAGTAYEKNVDKTQMFITDVSKKHLLWTSEKFNEQVLNISSEFCSVSSDAFKNKTKLEKIFVDNTNLGISNKAFEGCTNLTNFIVKAQGQNDCISYYGQPFLGAGNTNKHAPLAIAGGNSTLMMDSTYADGSTKAFKYSFTPVTSFGAGEQYLNANNYYYLLNDIKTTGRLIVGNCDNACIAIDLNGHTIDRGLTVGPEHYGYVMVAHNQYAVNLRIDDTSDHQNNIEKIGKIKGGWTDTSSGHGAVENTGGGINFSPSMTNKTSVLDFVNGCVCENHAQYGGGIAIDDSSSGQRIFNFYNGFIVNNTAFSQNESGGNGGGVYIGKSSIFNMYNGTINNNHVNNPSRGAGVYLEDYEKTTMTMYGGKILDNYIDNIIGGIWKNLAKFVPIDVEEHKDYILE